MKRMANYLYSLVWFIGALVIIYFSNVLMQYAHKMSSTTYDVSFSAWFPVIISFVLGAYLAFIQGFPKRVQLHYGTLVIFMLCLIGLSYYIIWFYFKVPLVDIFFRLFSNDYGIFIIGMIAGYSMIKSVFSFDGIRKPS